MIAITIFNEQIDSAQLLAYAIIFISVIVFNIRLREKDNRRNKVHISR